MGMVSTNLKEVVLTLGPPGTGAGAGGGVGTGAGAGGAIGAGGGTGTPGGVAVGACSYTV
tara:strand:- start:57 stop:236 length:180 start_codon:yes stop_codon:yes gene_type:complete